MHVGESRRTLLRMDSDGEELTELADRSAALRAKIDRLQTELASVQREQSTIELKLQTLGLIDDDELKTSIDRPNSEPVMPPVEKPKDMGALKAAGAGAGLTMGVVLIVLLALNVLRSRGEVTSAPSSASSGAVPTVAANGSLPAASTAQLDAPPSASASTYSVSDLPVAPTAPPPVVLTAPIPLVTPPAAADAGVAASLVLAPGNGAMTIVCTPKCESISDNNVPLSPSNLTNVQVPAGTHKLVLSAPNGVKKTMLVNVVAGQVKEVKVSMDRDTPRDYGF